MIKAILFDWSGVLSDDMKTTYLTAIDVLKIRGINEPMDINRFKDLYELPWNRVYEKMGYNVDLSEENILWSREMPKHLHHTKLYPFTKKLLQDLKKEKIKVLIISSREENSIKQEIEQNKIGHLVDRIYSTPGNKKEKIHKILKEENLNNDEVMYIGDMAHDVDTAKYANIKSVAVLSGYDKKERLLRENPDFLVETAEELLDIVQKINLIKK